MCYSKLTAPYIAQLVWCQAVCYGLSDAQVKPVGVLRSVYVIRWPSFGAFETDFSGLSGRSVK